MTSNNVCGHNISETGIFFIMLGNFQKGGVVLQFIYTITSPELFYEKTALKICVYKWVTLLYPGVPDIHLDIFLEQQNNSKKTFWKSTVKKILGEVDFKLLFNVKLLFMKQFVPKFSIDIKDVC